MPAPVYADFASRFPALVADPVPSAAQITWIDNRLEFAYRRHDGVVWRQANPNMKQEAVLLFVAHQWVKESQDRMGSRGRQSTSKSVGGWSVTRSSVGGSGRAQAAWLASSTYGQEYLSLRDQIPKGPIVARG